MSNLLEVRLLGRLYGGGWMNVLHFRDNAETADQLAELAVEFETAWVNGSRSEFARDLLYDRIEVRDAINTNVAPHIRPLGLTGGGSGQSELFPSVAYVIQKKTALSGRRNRGRLYHPAVWGGDYQFGTIGAGATQRWQRIFTNWGPAFIGPGTVRWSLVVKHDVGEGFEPVTALILASRPGQMRTRGIGIGF